MIYGKTQKEFVELAFQKLGKGKRHAALWYREWMRKGAVNPDLFEKEALFLKEKISTLTEIHLPECIRETEEEGTCKYILKLKDELEIETVVIPMKTVKTLCVSSQVGCLRGCAFCETGKMGLLRNLTAEEIVVQVFFAKVIKGHPIRNLVFMGMGEPMDNLDEVLKAIQILTDPKGMGMHPRYITVSTSGHVEGIHRLKREGDPALRLAVSLNAPTEEIRNKIMPINKKWDMRALKEALKSYGAEVLIEYVLLEGINDSEEAARALSDYLAGLKVKLNLIPYNAQSRDRFSPPSEEVIQGFLKRMRNFGIYTLRRETKGRKVRAGCGQLGNLGLRRLSLSR